MTNVGSQWGLDTMGEKEEKALRRVVLESGIEVKPTYGPDDLAGFDYARDLGEPGSFPFTRGIHRYMYRDRVWTMRQYLGFGTPRESNHRFKYLISCGQNALNVAFDLPTQMGLDSDDPAAQGEVGRVGMAVDTLRDMEEAFEGIDLGAISVSLTINAVATVLVAMYLTVAEKQGLSKDRIAGTPQNDILKEVIGRGAWIFDLKPSVKMVGDIIEFCSRNYPRYSPVSVCGYHIRESGANPAQEIAYAYCIAEAYIQNVLDRGLAIDEFAPRFSFNFNIFGNLWEQVAKFRAARRVWARLLKEKHGARNPRSMQMRMIAGGGGSGLTKEEPENNIVRGAYYALASALGGAQTMALCCYDEAYTIPTPKASKISLRTMQILAEEIGLADTVDPLAGSYFIESLTSAMEQRIWEYMERIHRLGGMVNAIAQGYVQRELAAQALDEQRKLRSGEMVKVGVNRYVDEAEARENPAVELHPYDRAKAEEQVRRLHEIRRSRDNDAVHRSLARLKDSAQAGENLMPPILEAVRAYTTVGEITKVLKEVYGEFREPAVL
jgi:methylmalonyl-CoA mutase N-terminal domain/subunit